ncbi:STAS domain-containing protein [Streptomyces sp. NPDC097981]|uniref:STAS domain-containing protein n=1 Tax=Streptomyces sp. NPDC097981 TaxID=3155428 RepID=UPI003318FED7
MAGQLPQDAGGNGIDVEILDHAVTIRPTGEIDIDTAPALHLALSEALAHASAAKPVAVDCSGLTFCDSSALNALLAARRAAQEAGTVIRLAAPGPQLQRLLEMTGARSLFPVDPDPPAGRQVRG